MNKIEIVVGSWGSYNACNDKALGSDWLDLSEYGSWEEMAEELTKQGFELDGIDEELFIQDIMGLDVNNCDNMHPQRLFDLVQKSGILESSNKYNTAIAFIEIQGFSEWEYRVDDKEDCWDDDVYFYKDYDLYDWGQNYIWSTNYKIPDFLKHYFDYEAFAKDMNGVYEVNGGVLEICD